jgi:hypothetical protein
VTRIGGPTQGFQVLLDATERASGVHVTRLPVTALQKLDPGLGTLDGRWEILRRSAFSREGQSGVRQASLVGLYSLV